MRCSCVEQGDEITIVCPDHQRLVKAALARLVYCVRCLDGDDDLVHIFSTQEKQEAFANADPRLHVLYDYVIDCPGRMEQVPN